MTCPHCKNPISEMVAEPVAPKGGNARRAVAYCCPMCDAVLGLLEAGRKPEAKAE